MVKISHKVFKAVVNELSEALPILCGSGSEFSYFITEPRKFKEVTRLSEDIRKPWLMTTLNEINNLINNHNFLFGDPEKGDPVTPCMDIYKTENSILCKS